MEAHGRCDVGGPVAPEEPGAGRLDAPADDVGVRADAELAAEAANEVRHRSVETGGGFGQGERLCEVFIEQLAELAGNRVVGAKRHR